MIPTYDSGLILVFGAVKSGKSEWAEKIVNCHSTVTYIATHKMSNPSVEWIERIEKHKNRRPSEWSVIESSDINKVINNLNSAETLLIDSLGGIVSQFLVNDNSIWEAYVSDLIQNISSFKGLIVIVVEEVGWGVSPATDIGNIFRDRLGDLSRILHANSLDSWLLLHGRAINIFNNSMLLH